MVALMLFPGLPERAVMFVLLFCGAVMVFALIMYTIFFLRLIHGGKAD